MSNSNLNIKDLEKQFDALLYSFTREDINRWYRFNQDQERLDLLFSGEFQPLEVKEVEFSTQKRKSIPILEIEVFDYIVSEAC